MQFFLVQMKKLVPGTRIYVYQNQVDKAMTSDSPTARKKKRSGGQVQHKNKDGTTRLTSPSKEICLIRDSVTCYFSTHLKRVHKFKKDSDRYKDAIQRRRKYLERKKSSNGCKRATR